VQMDLIASVVPIVGGCQARNQPGTFDMNCPSIPSPVGGTIAGCCRADGTCGVDLGVVGTGCTARVDAVEFCGRGGSAGMGGFPGTGGVVGSGGSVGGAGGVTEAGGAPSAGGSAPIEQCYNQARSDCERCACKSCFDYIAPCYEDVGCPAILQCANLTGCSGADCLQPSTCQSVIDRDGGVGSTSVSLALPLFQCLRSSGCACGFAP
jgi:hypothetical protein